MARCCTRYFRCGCCDVCTACCLWPAERQIRATADRLFDTVNQDETCCGCKDQVLNKTEVMLLMRMLQDEEQRHAPAAPRPYRRDRESAQGEDGC